MELDEQFFQSVGLANASDEQKARFTDQFSETVQNRIALKLADVLSDEQLEHFDELLEKNKDEEAFEYLQQAYPEYDNFVQQEIDAAKQEFVKDLSAIAERLKS